MKTIIFFSILFWAVALPVFSELTPQDLDKIRLIINDSEKRIKEEIKRELKEDITSSEQNLRNHIDLKIDSVEKRLSTSEQNLRNHIDLKIDSVEKRLSTYNWVLYVLMPLIVAAIGIPTAIMAWRSGRDRSLERQIEILTQEMEALKQQRIVNP